MQPASSIPALPENATVTEARELFKTSESEQLVLYRGSLRRITGMISLFDLMNPALSPTSPLKPMQHKLMRLRADLSLTRAFRRLRQSNEAVALVTDRSSRTIGLLHLRDIAGYIISAE
jgi:CBS domain containing-hemolysin-like protein